MPGIDPDDLPKKKVTHQPGQDLALLSFGELAERIGLLREEIARLEAEMARKRASQTAADAFSRNDRRSSTSIGGSAACSGVPSGMNSQAWGFEFKTVAFYWVKL